MSRTRTETPERHLMKRHGHSQVISLVLCSVWKHILVKETSLWSSVWRKELSTSAVRWDWCLSVCLQLRSLEKKTKKPESLGRLKPELRDVKSTFPLLSTRLTQLYCREEGSGGSSGLLTVCLSGTWSQKPGGVKHTARGPKLAH